jgi:hypothetical protein
MKTHANGALFRGMMNVSTTTYANNECKAKKLRNAVIKIITRFRVPFVENNWCRGDIVTPFFLIL